MNKPVAAVVFFMLGAFVLLCGCATAHRLQMPPLNPDDGFAPALVDAYAGIELLRLPAGSFMMGSPDTEPGRDDDEGPRHKVTLDSFFIGKYEVTQSQWQQVMRTNPSRFKGHPELPVESVFWDDVQKFLERLRKKTGLAFRLPTEAEWEYACRAGTETLWSSGDDPATLMEYAWFHNNAGGETHAVGRRLPNAWGLYDMHGNVSEFVADGRRGYLSRPVENPRGISSPRSALHRGGCWLYPASLCRSANRMAYDKKLADHIIGFRVALDANGARP